MKIGETMGSGISTGVIEQQLREWNARREDDREKARELNAIRFLTIARDEGSLGDEVAQELARCLGWHVFDKEIVSYIARNSYVRESLVAQLDQKSQSLIEDAISRLLRMPEYGSFGAEEYHESLIETLVCLAKHGSAILMGRGGNFALRENMHGVNGMYARITASPEVRIQRLCESLHASPEEIRHRMEADDEERRKFIRHYYRRDFDDLRSYDVVYNTDRSTAGRVAASILELMDYPEALKVRGESPSRTPPVRPPS
jgi:cytidylate kinase